MNEEKLIIVPHAKYEWHHFTVSIQFLRQSKWQIAGSWATAHRGFTDGFYPDRFYPSREAALLNYMPQLRDHMIRSNKESKDATEAMRISKKVDAWLNEFRAALQDAERPVQMEFDFFQPAIDFQRSAAEQPAPLPTVDGKAEPPIRKRRKK